MLFWPGLREGSGHGSVNFSGPRFFLLLNMNDVGGFRQCGDFLSFKVTDGFEEWFSCWMHALNNSDVPLFAIIAIKH